MTAAALRKQINQVVKRLPEDRLDALAKIVMYLDQPPLLERMRQGEKEIAEGKGVNWRKVRKDV
jgi:hypothetical protein